MKTIVVVGANDGTNQDVSAPFIEKGYRALLIEPCSFYYDKLIEKYDGDNVICENVAIANKVEKRYFYYPDPAEIVLKNLPQWAQLIGSFSLDHVKKHITKEDFRIIKETVNCVPLEELLKKHSIETVDILSIDVEGAEIEVLNSISLDSNSIQNILIETKHLDKEQKNQLHSMLEHHGYEISSVTDAWKNESFFAHLPIPSYCSNVANRKAVVSLVDKKFLPGFEVMVHSLLKHTKIDTNEWELVVLSNDLTEKDLHRIIRLWGKATIKRFDVEKYQHIQDRVTKTIPRANGSYHKFEIFGLSEFSKIVAFDSDLLILQDVSELFEKNVPFGAVKELLIEQFNTGVMVVNKENLGASVVDALIEATELLGPEEHLDQGTISSYFYDSAVELPVGLNFLKIYYNYPFLQNREVPPHIKILHYVIHKPWLWGNVINEIEKGTEGLNYLWFKEQQEMLKAFPEN